MPFPNLSVALCILFQDGYEIQGARDFGGCSNARPKVQYHRDDGVQFSYWECVTGQVPAGQQSSLPIGGRLARIYSLHLPPSGREGWLTQKSMHQHYWYMAFFIVKLQTLLELCAVPSPLRCSITPHIQCTGIQTPWIQIGMSESMLTYTLQMLWYRYKWRLMSFLGKRASSGST